MPLGEHTELDKCLWVKFVNNSGETIPPYSVLRVTGTTARNGEPFFTVEKPNSTQQKYYPINGAAAVGANQIGECTFSQQAIAAHESAPSYGTQVGPVDGEWTLSTSGEGFYSFGNKPNNRGLLLGEVVQVAAGTSAPAQLPDWGQVNDSSTQSFTGDSTWRQVTFTGGSDNGGILSADTVNDGIDCSEAAPTLLVTANAVYAHTDTGASATFTVVGAVQFSIRRNGSIQNPTWANQSVLGTDGVFPKTRFVASEIVDYSTASASDRYELWVFNTVDINITEAVLTLVEADPLV